MLKSYYVPTDSYSDVGRGNELIAIESCAVAGLDADAPTGVFGLIRCESIGDNLVFWIDSDAVELRLVAGDPGRIADIFVVALLSRESDEYRIGAKNCVNLAFGYVDGVDCTYCFRDRLCDEDCVPDSECVGANDHFFVS